VASSERSLHERPLHQRNRGARKRRIVASRGAAIAGRPEVMKAPARASDSEDRLADIVASLQFLRRRRTNDRARLFRAALTWMDRLVRCDGLPSFSQGQGAHRAQEPRSKPISILSFELLRKEAPGEPSSARLAFIEADNERSGPQVHADTVDLRSDRGPLIHR
jgi:hypothetical protein